MRYLRVLLLCFLVVQCTDDSDDEAGADSDKQLKIKVSDDGEGKHDITVTLWDEDGEVVKEGDHANDTVVISWRCDADADWVEAEETISAGSVTTTVTLPEDKELSDCTFKVEHTDTDRDIASGDCTGDKCTDDDAASDGEDDDDESTSSTCGTLNTANKCATGKVYDSSKVGMAATVGNYKTTCCKVSPTVEPPTDGEQTTCSALHSARSHCGAGKEYDPASANRSTTAADYATRCCMISSVSVSARNIKSIRFTRDDRDYGAYEFTLAVIRTSNTVKLGGCAGGTMFLHKNNTITKVPSTGTRLAIGNHTAFVVGSKFGCRVVYGSVGYNNTGATFATPTNIDYVGHSWEAMKGIRLWKYGQSGTTRVALTLETIENGNTESQPRKPNHIYMSVDAGQTWKKASGWQGPSSGQGRCDTSSEPCWLNFDNWNALANWSATSSNNQVLINYNSYAGERNVWYYDGDN